MNKDIYIPFLLSLFAGMSTLIGGLFIFIKTRKISEFITFSLSFSISIMVLISLFDMLPNGLSFILSNYGYLFGIIISILTFILGYLTVYLIINKIKSTSSLYRIGMISMISLMLHNFPE